ncbi:Uma2 family endonuclease [Streptomyces sp. AC627_RSS907]|uniref:Uma2 family endonuclease n=1 Tax=Streptomyces sp. AC627_RSS907 TaxID=2823684 RepID=UPI001C25096B|nr:Uma2 family endonuclease [Streptomyces sp. AC627_RSS907]
MSAASVGLPHGGLPLIAEANRLMDRNPGYRVAITGGRLVVTPPPDVPHSRALTTLMRPFIASGLDDGETEVHQGIGLRLPMDAEHYAIPDLAIVDTDIEDHPDCADYSTHRVHSPGETVTLPGSLGAEVTLDVAEILAAGRSKPAPGQG